MDEIINIEEYIENNQLEKANELIEKLITEEISKEKLFFLRGKIHYKKQEWGEAINDFNKVLEINPDNTEAKSQIEMAIAILGYYTPDMFNP
ncbi:tetratricopeptide repeat protein [Sunxiuqinia sp. A32]